MFGGDNPLTPWHSLFCVLELKHKLCLDGSAIVKYIAFSVWLHCSLTIVLNFFNPGDSSSLGKV